MPSQEPPVDDKNDGVDLPSEETDGSRCPFPQLCGPPSSEPCSAFLSIFLAFPPDSFLPALQESMWVSWAGDSTVHSHPSVPMEMGGAAGLPW